MRLIAEAEAADHLVLSGEEGLGPASTEGAAEDRLGEAIEGVAPEAAASLVDGEVGVSGAPPDERPGWTRAAAQGASSAGASAIAASAG